MGDQKTNGVGAPKNQAPSLAVAINTSEYFLKHPFPVNLEDQDQDKVKEDLKLILLHINSHLHLGLSEAWNSTEGLGSLSENSLNSAEEQWARLVSEMLLCIPYAGPGQTYFNNGARDRDLFGAMMRASDPAYPIVAACQHLCTMGAITRGFTFKTGVFEADISANLKNVVEKSIEPGPGNWFTEQEYRAFAAKDDKTKELKRTRTIEKTSLGPGSVFDFYAGKDEKGNRKSGAHIGFVLRVNEDLARIQFFDTGAMSAAQPEQPRPRVMGPAGEGGNYDYGWIPYVRGPSNPGVEYQGLGVVLPRDTAQMGAAITKMRTARPLGFARLALRKRSDKTILFATPLLFMHDHSDANINFSVARYLWSLRCLPGIEQIEGTWLIYVPQGELRGEVLDGPRDRLLGSMLEAAYQKKKTPKTVPSVLPMLGDTDPDLRCIEYLSTSGDRKILGGTWAEKAPKTFDEGLVYVEHSISGIPSIHSDKRLNLPWDRPSGSIQLDRDDFKDFSYLMGDWDGTGWNQV